MTQGKRVRLSAAQRTEMWSRWKAGQSLHEIGRAFGKSHVSIHFMLSQHGGIDPAARRRSLATLTLIYYCGMHAPAVLMSLWILTREVKLG